MAKKIIMILTIAIALVITMGGSVFAENDSNYSIKNIGGSGQDSFSSVCQTSDGGYAVVGDVWSDDGDFKGLRKGNLCDAMMAKFNNKGAIESITIIGGSGNDSFYSVCQISDKGYVAAGSSDSKDGDFNGLNKFCNDAIVVKIDKLP